MLYVYEHYLYVYLNIYICIYRNCDTFRCLFNTFVVHVWYIVGTFLLQLCYMFSFRVITFLLHLFFFVPCVNGCTDPWFHASMHGSMHPWFHGSMQTCILHLWIHAYTDPRVHGSKHPWTMVACTRGSKDPCIHASAHTVPMEP